MTPAPGTRWGKSETDDIWLRHTFELDHKINAPLILDAFVDDFADIYINGVQLPRAKFVRDRYQTLNCSNEVKLRHGRNIVAVHCWNSRGYGKIDVSLRAQEDEEAIDAILAQLIDARPDIEQFQERRAEWQADRDRWKKAAAAKDHLAN